jgi:hypothetical protein
MKKVIPMSLQIGNGLLDKKKMIAIKEHQADK